MWSASDAARAPWGIGSMTPAAEPDGNAFFFDGRSNRKRSVTLRLGDGLEIVERNAVVGVWPYDDLRRVDGPSNTLRLSSLSALPLARLETGDAALHAAIIAHCASLDAGHVGRHTGRIVFWSLAALCSIVVLSYYGIPAAADRLAPLVPAAFERRMGEAFDIQVRSRFGGKTCTGAGGPAAFTMLIDKIKRAGEMEIPLKAEVLASPIANAFALPGGRIYLLSGLLQKATDPDEIAGILAHELGHVKHRDHMRHLIQTGGTAFLFGLLFGDVTGAGAAVAVGRTVLDASYSREAEQAADDFAIKVMHRLGRSPAPMGELLFRVAGARNTAFSILASHPLTAARRALMMKEARPNTGAALLSVKQWLELKGICG
jgi:Zn-dependent protease with chaperone function